MRYNLGWRWDDVPKAKAGASASKRMSQVSAISVSVSEAMMEASRFRGTAKYDNEKADGG